MVRLTLRQFNKGLSCCRFLSPWYLFCICQQRCVRKVRILIKNAIKYDFGNIILKKPIEGERDMAQYVTFNLADILRMAGLMDVHGCSVF